MGLLLHHDGGLLDRRGASRSMATSARVT